MKGILLAGGSGSRLFPITRGISKQLIPVYDKPMVYYPLSVLMLAGIREILVVSTPEHLGLFQKLLGDGKHIGLRLSYQEQLEPRGLADAFLVGERFIGDEAVCMILGDNLFYGQGFSAVLEKAGSLEEGAQVFAYYVKNPQDFGVVEWNGQGEVVSIQEKPRNPRSHFAIPGLYFFDARVVSYAKDLVPSARGELEITDLLVRYQQHHLLRVELLGRGFAWLDTGTCDGLLEASNFVQAIQRRQGLYIACLEEIAFRKGYIDRQQLLHLAKQVEKTEYGEYLLRLVDEED
ncbi:MAG TPA: glucose-1-phosphate thymidylyltransferase RfbA [Thermotogota bacterium]|nr:glucose-1-phosphate thymidylyltransferase RfbA [Thermotogota bacterium]